MTKFLKEVKWHLIGIGAGVVLGGVIGFRLAIKIHNSLPLVFNILSK